MKVVKKNAFKGCKNISVMKVKSKKLTKKYFKNLLLKAKVKSIEIKSLSAKKQEQYTAWIKEIAPDTTIVGSAK